MRSGCIPIYLNDCFGKGAWRFLRQVVADATLDGPVCVLARELLGVKTGLWMRCSVGITLKRDSGHRDHGKCGKSLLQIVVFRLAFGETKLPTVVVNDDGDVIRVG